MDGVEWLLGCCMLYIVLNTLQRVERKTFIQVYDSVTLLFQCIYKYNIPIYFANEGVEY